MPESYIEQPYVPLDPRLGRFVEFDIESANYPIRSLLGPVTALRTRLWPCASYLDQDGVGACVGFSCAHDIIADPVPLPADNAFGMRIYKEAQKIDPWPGENYEGTSVLAGIKTLVNFGYVSEYRWAFGIQDVLETLSNYGPIIFGLNWYDGMFYPDAQGIIRPTGGLAGGHAILGVGYDHERQLVRFHNSWGSMWGIGGDCFMTVADLTTLLAQRGEGCVPVIRIDPNPPPIPPPPVYVAFGMVGSTVYHDFHKVRGTLHKRYTSFQEAMDEGRRACKVCKPGA